MPRTYSAVARSVAVSLVVLHFLTATGLLELFRSGAVRLTFGPSPVFAQSSLDVAVELTPGLNLFSLPVAVAPATDSCFELLSVLGGSSSVQSISRFNTTTQLFEVCAYSGSTASGENFSIRDGEGYQVRMKADKTVVLNGAAVCPAVNLKKGTNLIGVPSPTAGLSCFDLLTALGAEKVATTQGYDKEVGAFEACTFVEGGAPAGDDFPIVAGEAYLVSMRQDVASFNVNDPGRCQATCPAPTITNISPRSGAIGAEITLTGTNFDCGDMRTLTCGGVSLTIASLSATQIKTVIPPDAQDCRVSLMTDGGTIAVPESLNFDVVLDRDFSLAINPDQSSVLPGSSTLYRVSANGADDFTDLITLSVSGLPSGVTGSFFPPTITAGQASTLTVQAAANAAQTTKSFTVTGAAKIDGVDVQRSTAAQVTVLAGGRSAIVGQFKLANGPPLVGVRLQFTSVTGSPLTETDSGGNFQFLDLPAGTHTMSIDASHATPVDPSFPIHGPLPIYGMDVTVEAGKVTQLTPFSICPPPDPNTLTRLQTAAHDQVITDPRFPGASFTVPAGTTIMGWDNAPKDRMGMERLSPDEIPVPPPPFPTKSLYQPFFGTPMGGLPVNASGQPVPIPVTLPNDLDLKPGEKAELWYYDAAPFMGVPGEWRLAGLATVSADGSQVVADPGVGLQRFCGVCGLTCLKKLIDSLFNKVLGGPEDGDPVHLELGQMTVDKLDLVLPGRIPALVHRTYNPFDPFASIAGFQLGLGAGWALSVDVVLLKESASLRRLILPGNSRFAFAKQPDETFVNTTHPQFAGAVLTDEGTSHTLRLKDGSRWRFMPSSNANVTGVWLLSEQIDRNHNRLVIEHNGDRVSRIIEPSGRELTFTLSSGKITQVADPLGRVVRYGYNGAGRLATVTDTEGGVTRYTYDTQGRILSIADARNITYLTNEYDADGRVTRQTQVDGGVWTFQYAFPQCARALVCNRSLTSPTSVTVTDPRGHATTTRLSSTGFASEVVDALGQKTQFERDVVGRVTAVIDPLGRVTRFAYDAAGNVTRITDSANHVSTFEYESTFNRLTKLTDPLGNITRFTYDTRGNLTKISDPLGHDTHVAYDNVGQPVSTTDALGHRTTLSYDFQGNLTTVADPLGNSSSLMYDLVSRLTAQTDPRGRTTRFAYDDLNQLVSIVDALNGATAFTYDENGNVLSVKDALNQTTAYAYDNMDRLTRRTDPLGAQETFDYDRLGNLTRHVDRKGQVSTFSYDALDRPLVANYADSSTSFIYDTVGRLMQATDSLGGSIVNEYDELDRLITQTSGQGAVAYAYDALDRRVSMQVIGQAPVNYTYDANSRLTRISQSGQIVDFDYDALDRRTRLTLPNGVATEYTYDIASRLTEQIYRNATGVLGNLTYQYDAAGSRTSLGGSFARTLLPDPIASATYDAANRQRAFGNKAMDFDANGNVSAIMGPNGTTSLTWDARDRLTAMNGPGVAASFTYDVAGRRIAKQINSQLTRFFYDGVDTVQEEVNGTPINSLRSLGIDELLVRNSEYPLADALGGSLGLANQNGAVQTEYTYEPFGRTTATGLPSNNPFQYTGRENDGTGLYYYRARYYDPQAGRFVSEDPIGFGAGGTNLFSYAVNNPTKYSDPEGKTPFVLLPIVAELLVTTAAVLIERQIILLSARVITSRVGPPLIAAGMGMSINPPYSTDPGKVALAKEGLTQAGQLADAVTAVLPNGQPSTLEELERELGLAPGESYFPPVPPDAIGPAEYIKELEQALGLEPGQSYLPSAPDWGGRK